MLRLRVSVADRSGALAQAATVIGLHGGNIRSIDVHRSADESAVDDLVVEFAVEPDIEAMRTDLAMNASATLITCAPADAVDPVEAGLREVLALLEGGSFLEAVGRVCSGGPGWELDETEASATDAGRAALDRVAVVWMPSGDVPAEAAAELGDEAAVLAVPVPQAASHKAAGAEGHVAFVARPLELGFTETEVARVEALVAIARILAGRA